MSWIVLTRSNQGQVLCSSHLLTDIVVSGNTGTPKVGVRLCFGGGAAGNGGGGARLKGCAMGLATAFGGGDMGRGGGWGSACE